MALESHALTTWMWHSLQDPKWGNSPILPILWLPIRYLEMHFLEKDNKCVILCLYSLRFCFVCYECLARASSNHVTLKYAKLSGFFSCLRFRSYCSCACIVSQSVPNCLQVDSQVFNLTLVYTDRSMLCDASPPLFLLLSCPRSICVLRVKSDAKSGPAVLLSNFPIEHSKLGACLLSHVDLVSLLSVKMMIPSSVPVHVMSLQGRALCFPCILLFLSSLSVIITHGQCY